MALAKGDQKAPPPTASGIIPKIVVALVMRTARSRLLAPSHTASPIGCPSSRLRLMLWTPHGSHKDELSFNLTEGS